MRSGARPVCNGREIEFWLQVGQELAGLSVAGEEDPDVTLDELGPGALKDKS